MIKCIIVDHDKSSRKEIEDLVSQIRHLEIIKACGNLSEAADILLKQPVDILFLDIPVAGQNGVGFLEDLKYGKPRIIITSKAKDVAKQAFDIDAVDFILKPITASRVIKALAKALLIESAHEKEIAKNNSSIFIKDGQRFVKTRLHDVILIEALADYVHIHTVNKKYTIHATMKSMESKLPKKDFVRVHKSFIVRLDHVSKVDKGTLFVEKKTVPVSATYRKGLMDRLRII